MNVILALFVTIGLATPAAFASEGSIGLAYGRSGEVKIKSIQVDPDFRSLSKTLYTQALVIEVDSCIKPGHFGRRIEGANCIYKLVLPIPTIDTPGLMGFLASDKGAAESRALNLNFANFSRQLLENLGEGYKVWEGFGNTDCFLEKEKSDGTASKTYCYLTSITEAIDNGVVFDRVEPKNPSKWVVYSKDSEERVNLRDLLLDAWNTHIKLQESQVHERALKLIISDQP